MTTEEKFILLKEQQKAIQANIDALAPDLFHDKCSELFVQNPNVEAFRWGQYTPSFNDGDPCYFISHWDSASVKLFGVEDWHGEYEEYDEAFNEKIDPFLKAIMNTFMVLNDEFESMFGNGSQITVTREGVEVENYYGRH